MNYDKFITTIVSSQPKDWLYDNSKGIFVFRNNLLISIKADQIDDSKNDRFREDWAEGFPDSEARKQ